LEIFDFAKSEVPYAQLVSEDVRKRIGQITLTTATDGNHGRGVAWAAERLGQKSVVYMPRGLVASRVAANGIRILANPMEGDAAVEAGESGAVGIGLIDLLANSFILCLSAFVAIFPVYPGWEDLKPCCS
jgi:threonine dehydratase